MNKIGLAWSFRVWEPLKLLLDFRKCEQNGLLCILLKYYEPPTTDFAHLTSLEYQSQMLLKNI